MKAELIAPCGMNCNVCSNFLALQNDTTSKGVKLPDCKCCRPRNKNCSFVKKRCELLGNGKVEFCYECAEFPCELIKGLAKRYETRYHMNMVDNLRYIKEHVMKKLLEKEQKKWECLQCGGVTCCHNGICYSCGLEKMKTKKKHYRWDD